jgi:hypothetical protein
VLLSKQAADPWDHIAGRLASELALHRTPHGSRVITVSLDRAIDRTRLAGAAPIPVRRPR